MKDVLLTFETMFNLISIGKRHQKAFVSPLIKMNPGWLAVLEKDSPQMVKVKSQGS